MPMPCRQERGERGQSLIGDTVGMMQLQHSIVWIMIAVAITGCCSCARIVEYRKEAYFAKGKQLYEDGEYGAALEQFGNALAFDAGYFDALYLSGMCWYDRKVYHEAANWFEKALSERPDNLTVYVVLAESLMGWNRFPRAIYFIENGLAIDPENAKLNYLKIKAQVRSRADARVAQAVETMEALIRQGRDDSWLYLLLSEAMILRGRVDKAAELLARPGLEEDPDWVDVMLLFAERLKQERLYDRYVDAYTAVARRAADPGSYIQELARFYRESGEVQKEEQTLRALIGLRDNIDAKIELIDFLMRQNRLAEARDMLTVEIEHEPHDQQLAMALVRLYIIEDDISAAITFLEKRLQAVPASKDETAAIMTLLAEMYLEGGNLSSSEHIANVVLEGWPNNSQALFVLSKIRMQRGEYLIAIGDLRRLAGMNPDNPEYNQYLGLAHLGRNETIMARKAFMDALDVAPGYKPALMQYAKICVEEGSYTELKFRMRNYLQLNSNDSEVLQLLNSMP